MDSKKRANEGKDEPGAKRLRTSGGVEEEELQRPRKSLWRAAYHGDLQTVKQCGSRCIMRM